MYLYKRGKIWWVQYMVDGVRHCITTHTKNRKVAEQWVANIEMARNAPTFEEAVQVLRIMFKKPATGIIHLDAAWENYERLAKAVGKLTLAKKSLRDRRCDLKHFIEWVGNNAATVKTVEGVTGAIAVAYAEDLARDPTKKSKTRKNIISNLSAVWRMLEKTSPNVKNPWTNIAPKVTDGTRIDSFTPEQEERVLSAAKKIGKDWYPVCIIARHTGLRYGSIANMRWDEVDIKAGVIRHKPRKTIRFDIAVELPIIDPIRKVLSGLKRSGNDFLFPLHAELYGVTTKSALELLNFREVLDAAGISGNYTFHSWRHTAATRLAAAGADIETRKKILGHTQDMTAERYDHDSHLGEIRKAMENAAAKS